MRLAAFSECGQGVSTLHGDITADHVLLSRQTRGWEITGLIDFGDARVGDSLYEFVAPLAFYTFGRPRLTRVLLESYGLELLPMVRERVTTFCLLHEFGRVQDFMEQHPVADGRAFERALWG